mmetsp:Transcript_57125/g.180812  ORF Transcript_57125/g.180812 Transcript_57125/m.180812 type:complete len:255 (+) Transcript_57125:132-896(+)
MLPTRTNPSGGGSGGGKYRAYAFLPTYLRRIVKYRQMDFEATGWLMLNLCLSPKTAYRHTTYHKQTKNQWARDDPAFVVICCALVAIAATAYCVAFGNGLWHSLLTVASAVLVDFLLLGCALATACWLLANKYLRGASLHGHTIDQRVEWLYAFDVHCNAYFPMFLALYVLQYFLSPILLAPGFIPALLSNLLYGAALSYYHYVNFLGYNALPFLEHTELFLYPIGGIVVILPFAILGSFNPTRFVLGIFFAQY